MNSTLMSGTSTSSIDLPVTSSTAAPSLPFTNLSTATTTITTTVATATSFLSTMVMSAVTQATEMTTFESCTDRWNPANHFLFQLGHVALLVSYLAPHTLYGVLFLHGMLILGFLLLTTWAWAVLCAPDIFSWNFSFMLINSIQFFVILYRVRPVRLSLELENIYARLFEPLRVPKVLYKKLISSEYCTILTLHQGEPYAQQEITRTDRLGLLIHGTVNVICNGQMLHHISEMQFLDSPEFESTVHGDEKFHVSVIAATPCRYVFWQRSALEYLFVKEPYLATIMGTIIGRDITNKLYTLNEKVKLLKGTRVDIRLPSVSTVVFSSSRSDIQSTLRTSQDIQQDVPTMTSAGEDIMYDMADDEDVFEELSEKTRIFPNGLTHSRAAASPYGSTSGH